MEKRIFVRPTMDFLLNKKKKNKKKKKKKKKKPAFSELQAPLCSVRYVSGFSGQSPTPASAQSLSGALH